MTSTALGASIPAVTHHHAHLNGTDLHWVSAGTDGTPILLVHGFPESWWTFHKLIPLLAAEHRVFAVDLPGFGDSATNLEDYSSAAMAGSLRALIDHLGLGPVHLTGQDIGGIGTFRLAADHPGHVLSFAAIETALPGFGLERFADVAHGGLWHFGFLGAPGIPELLLAGREREFLTGAFYPARCRTPGAITEQDVEEFTRILARPDGLRGTTGVYSSMLQEGEAFRRIVARGRLRMPVLAVSGGTDGVAAMMEQVAENVTAAKVHGVGHLVAMEAPDTLAETLLGFYRKLDA